MIQLPLLLPNSDWVAPSDYPSLQGAKQLCVDVETKDPGLKELGPGTRRGSYIVGISLRTDDGRGGYYPIRHDGGGNLDPRITLDWARDELNRFDGHIVGTNLIYDLDFCANEGITFTNAKSFLDVQIAEPLIDENRLRYNLNALALDYLGESKRTDLMAEAAIAYGFGKDIGGSIWRLPARFVGPYAEGDTELPLRILPLQMKRLEAEGLMPLFRIESELIPALLSMRRRGVRVSPQRVEEVRAKLVKMRDEALQEVRRHAGPRAELMEADSLAQAVEDRGIPVARTPKSRAPQINKALLERYANDPLIAAISAGRKVNTIINMTLDGITKHLINGRVHCEFNQLKSDVGGTIARFSCSNPNLQQVASKDKDLAPLVRSCFIPEDGEEWACFDLSHIEYRLLTHYAVGPGAEEAREKYRNDPNTDFHSACAIMAKKDPNDGFVRKRIKNVNFGKVYGSGVDTMATTMGCSREEAQEFINMYDRELPWVKKTFEKASNTAKSKGYITTLLGRRQRFD